MSAIVQLFEHSLALPFFGIGMKTDFLFQMRLKEKITKYAKEKKSEKSATFR